MRATPALVPHPAGPSRPGATPRPAPPGVRRTLASPGRPLDAGTRAFFESRLGYDFGSVRVHADARAAAAARRLHARAFTLGHHVVFGEGELAPRRAEGRRLLAHELAHVVQQSRGATPEVMREDPPHGSTPSELIEAYTDEIGRLDETGLGQHLYLLLWRTSFTAAHVDFAHRVLDELSSSDRDEVSYAFTRPLSDSLLENVARTDRGRGLLQRMRDEMATGWPTSDESDEAARIDRIGRSIRTTVTDEPGLPRKSMVLKMVRYAGSTTDPATACSEAQSIYSQCGVDVTCPTPVRASRAETLADLDGDLVLHVDDSDETDAVRARSGASGRNQVPVALVDRVRVPYLGDDLRGFTRGGITAATHTSGPETVAHEAGHYFGLSHVSSPPRLMHEESRTRTGTALTPWECSEVRRRL